MNNQLEIISMIPNEDKTKLKEDIFEKLEELRKMIYEYVNEYGWHDMNDDVYVRLGDVRDILKLNLLYSNCCWLEGRKKKSPKTIFN
jgi:hypothetical protein